MSLRCDFEHVEHAKEALRRSKFKFPGRQKIFVSRKYGFTKLIKADFYRLQKQGKIISDGVSVKVRSEHGPLPKMDF